MSKQENLYARRARERQHRAALRDQQPTIDEQLSRLEEDIRRLKVEFDIYFNGAAKRPPYDTKSRVETQIKRLSEDRSLSFAQRYRYNSLVARHTSFLQLWRRTTQAREEGRDPSAAAAARAASQAEEPRGEAAPRSFVCDDPHADVATVRALFDTLLDAHRQCGEPADDLSFPRFHRMIAAQSDALKGRTGCERVHFSIAVEGGRVSFKAKADG